jgi:hypothetical protein
MKTIYILIGLILILGLVSAAIWDESTRTFYLGQTIKPSYCGNWTTEEFLYLTTKEQPKQEIDTLFFLKSTITGSC